MNQMEWFRHNDEIAQAAMRRAGIWYQPPYYRSYEEPVAQPEQPAPQPSPEPEMPIRPNHRKLRQFIPRTLGQKIIVIAADIVGVDPKDIVGPSRRQQHIQARHAVIWVLVMWCGYSTPQTGRVVNRDHSSVLHAISKTDRYADVLPELLRRLREDRLL